MGTRAWYKGAKTRDQEQGANANEHEARGQSKEQGAKDKRQGTKGPGQGRMGQRQMASDISTKTESLGPRTQDQLAWVSDKGSEAIGKWY